MDNLDFSFTIEIDGTPIAKVSNDNKASRVQAKTGADAAVLILKNSRLQSGDWILGRSTSEDRSLLPKQVFWFKASDSADSSVQPVAAHQDGESHELKFNNNACLMVENGGDGSVFADLMGDERCKVVVKKRE